MFKGSVRMCRYCKASPALPEKDFCSDYCEMMYHKNVDRGYDNRRGHEPEATVSLESMNRLEVALPCHPLDCKHRQRNRVFGSGPLHESLPGSIRRERTRGHVQGICDASTLVPDRILDEGLSESAGMGPGEGA